MPVKHLFIAFIICVLSSKGQAGTLDDLEESATKPKERSSSKSSSSSSSDSSSRGSAIGDELAASLAEFMVEVTLRMAEAGLTLMAEGGKNSLQRYANDSPNSGLALYRQKGDPILPTLKLSSHWLEASNNINAQLNRIEGGYGLIGFSYTENRLTEDGDSLTLKNTLLHYRMSFGNNLSWDFAYGRGRMNGNQVHEGDVLAMPIRLRISPKVHFEYYPVWSSYNGGSLSEHQFSFNWQHKHYGFTTGFKNWSAGPTTVNGLFAGLYVNF